MKKILLVLLFVSLMMAPVAQADTILFPYINSNPGNLSTIVSVINTGNEATECPAPDNDILRLHYRYMTKPVTAAAVDACAERDFIRPTTLADIVSFDVAGNLGGGRALFSDETNYNFGAGNPRFDLPNFGFTDARRGYLLVTHYCGGVTNADTHTGRNNLDGDAVLLDIVNGAAWGYRAVIADQTAPGIGNYAFTNGAIPPGAGSTTDLLPENIAAPVGVPFTDGPNRYSRLQSAPIYPPSDFTTRFFVTPLFLNNNLGTAGNLGNMTEKSALRQKRTQIRLIDRNGDIGVTDRDEAAGSGGGPVHVRCVAGIDLHTLTHGSFGTWWDAQGGWAFVDLLDPVVIDPATETIVGATDHAAIVFKLEFGAPTFTGGKMINSATLIRDGRIQ